MHLLALVSLVLAADPKVELGRRLFMDPAASRSGRFSCSACHDPEHGFSDPRRLSVDENGATRRHSQPVVDLARGESFHWDGEFDSVRDLLTARLGSRAEASEVARRTRTRQYSSALVDGRGPDPEAFRSAVANLVPPYYGPGSRSVEIAVRLERDGLYADGFREAYGSARVSTERILDALDRYVRSLESAESPFDRFCRGDGDALDAEQQRGFALFIGKAACVACHVVDPGKDFRPTLSDGRFHNTGIAFRTRTAEGERAVRGSPPDGGAGEMDFVARDVGKFKTPSLRDVQRRAPFMHDGSLATLEEVVRYYDRGGTRNWNLDGRISPLDLTDREVSDLVAFLGSLTGDTRAGIGPARKNPAWTRIKVVDLEGKPIPRLPVRAHPAGDRLLGGQPGDPPLRLATDGWGYLAFRFPSFTHVRLESAGYDFNVLLPDCARSAEVIAAPRGVVVLEVRGSLEEWRKRFASARGQPRYPHDRGEVLAVFQFARRIDRDRAIFTAEAPWSLPWAPPSRAKASVFGVDTDLDLSGGWTDPIDLPRGS